MADADEIPPSVLSVEHDTEPAEVRDWLRAGADPREVSPDRYNALHIQAFTDRPWEDPDQEEIIQILVDAGAELEAFANTQAGVWTPLQLAAAEGTLSSVRALIRAGANVDAADRYGETPLMLARCYPDKIELLLAAGADPSIRDAVGCNALDHARASLEGQQNYDPGDAPIISGEEIMRRCREDMAALGLAPEVLEQLFSSPEHEKQVRAINEMADPKRIRLSLIEKLTRSVELLEEATRRERP